MSDKELASAIYCVANERKCDVYLFAGEISRDSSDAFIRHCPNEVRQNAILILASYGGDAAAAFRLTRYLQERYEGSWALFIPFMCKSAGTIVALGADELIMSNMGELGPLDVQVREPDELWEYRSGLIPSEALKTIQSEAFSFFEETFLKIRGSSGAQIATRTAAEIASQLTVGLFEPLIRQINPLRGAHNRLSMRIAEEYGSRLGTPNVREGTLQRLVYQYPSHNFVVDFREATELFHNVSPPTEAQDSLARCLDPLVMHAIAGEFVVLHLSNEQFLSELVKENGIADTPEPVSESGVEKTEGDNSDQEDSGDDD